MLAGFIRHWVPLAVGVTVIAGTAFGIGQQILRVGANDPQVQVAEDAAVLLQAGASPSAVVPSAQTDMATSLAPWVIVFGPDRKPLAGSAILGGKPAEYPTSVFDNAPAGGRSDQVTWQPATGVRAASVVVGFKGGWVVAGRSLRLVEEEEDQAGRLALAGWLTALAATALAVLAARLVARRLEEATSSRGDLSRQ